MPQRKRSRLVTFVSNDASEPLNNRVTVGIDNEHLPFIHEMKGERSLYDLDPLSLMELIEEMEDPGEAEALLADIYRKRKEK